MKHVESKRPRVKLALRQQVLKRDDWRCQNCGRRENLEVHHKRMRSQGGDDSELNLITLCSTCHERIHS
jgi:5-methylcytosine-specific restriction endonuclease McrA